MNRTLVIGDIHGGYKALVQVLQRARVSNSDHLIFMGDYVDGWSESAVVIEFLVELGKKNRCTFIRGNHDTWCEDYLRTGNPNSDWYQHGGKGTLEQYRQMNDAEKRVHLAFFEKMEHYVIDDQNRLFIHAGFSSMHGPQKETYASNYSWDRTLWETALATAKNAELQPEFYPKRLKLFTEIFIGHTPTTQYGINKPINAANVWNVDTGAAFTGKLTALDIDSKTYWQSDVVRELYPREKGRNETSYHA